MTTTNVDYYVAGFNSDGKRVGSLICDFDPDKNPNNLAALKEKAKELFTDATAIEVITADDFSLYLDGYVRGTDGKPIPYVAPEPTEEEKKATQKAELTADYKAQVSELTTALQVAELNDDSDAKSSIQADFKELQKSYKTEMEGLA